MQRIYFDNAATTVLDSEVLAEMMPYLSEKFGNPSAIYSYGRESKQAIENARKKVARILHAEPGEINFTSGGTESTNTAFSAAIHDLGCQYIISSPLEHPATLRNVEYFEKSGQVRVSWLKHDTKGHINLEHLEELLASTNQKTFVSLMHANNEIGTKLPIKAVAKLCEKYNAIFHSDMVQTVGHYAIDLSTIPIHFISASGHKFHGPKGVGILFTHNSISCQPFIKGGSQERNKRGGTENLYGVVGFAKALEIAEIRMQEESEYIKSLKIYMMDQLKHEFPSIYFNGDAEDKSLYTILNAAFHKTDKTEMLLYNLDMSGVCVSSGSACASGASSISPVIQALYGAQMKEQIPIRFSFSKYNNKAEIDKVIDIIKSAI
jgi:cysteine desulfurase